MRKVPNGPLDRLKRAVTAIDRGEFALLEYEAVADKSEPGQYVMTVRLERLIAQGTPNKKSPRQSKVRELIFDEE